MSAIDIFMEEHPSLDSYWRSVILFGANVASYKFALAKSLLEIAPTGKTVITLEELADPFSKHLCEHPINSPKQITSKSSVFLDVCRGFNSGEVSYDELINTTVRKGFNNVIDAFHNVNREAIPVDFYVKDYSSSSRKIILTDEIFRLEGLTNSNNFMGEVEARWNLVETSWELQMASNLLKVDYDDEKKIFFVNSSDFIRRKDVTSARDALNGYQKGKCFYCFDNITLNANDPLVCDVDHFYPHTLKDSSSKVNLDGVWNLVLSCTKCNRGVGGKFVKVPSIEYLYRLHKRNEFLINSHHPLRETLMNQTGIKSNDRISFLRGVDRVAINSLIHRWDTNLVGEKTF